MADQKIPAIFFDRDGVLNVDTHYLYRKEDFEWVEGAAEAIRYVNERGYWAIVVTNQSGVARGFYGEEDVRMLHKWMNEELAVCRAHIDAFFYCPHHRQGVLPAYTMDCMCRKPKTGLLDQARARYHIDMTRSILIGDNDSDMECARNAGIQGAIFTGGSLYELIRRLIL